MLASHSFKCVAPVPSSVAGKKPRIGQGGLIQLLVDPHTSVEVGRIVFFCFVQFPECADHVEQGSVDGVFPVLPVAAQV